MLRLGNGPENLEKEEKELENNMTILVKSKDRDGDRDRDDFIISVELLSNKYINIISKINIIDYSKMLCGIDPEDREIFLLDMNSIYDINSEIINIYDNHHIERSDNIEEQFEEVLDILRYKIKDIIEKYPFLTYQERT